MIVANCETAEFNGLYEYDVWLGLNDESNMIWIKWDGNGHEFENIISFIASDTVTYGQPYIAGISVVGYYSNQDGNNLSLTYPDDPSIVWMIDNSDSGVYSNLTVTAIGDEPEPPEFPYPNGYRVTYDIGNGLEYADSTAWSGVTSTINTNRANLITVKISQIGTPTLPTTLANLFFYAGTAATNMTTLEFENLDVSNVSNFSQMCRGCTKLTTIIGIEDWDTSNGTNFGSMFYQCAFSSLDVSKWNTSKLTNAGYFVMNCTNLVTLDLSGWSTPLVTVIHQMCINCSNLVTIYVGDGWDMSAVTAGNSMFGGCTKLVGAVPYNASQTGVAMANWTTGYLTYKAPPQPETSIIPLAMAHYARMRS